MTDIENGPVDTAAKQPDIAAQIAKEAEAAKPAESVETEGEPAADVEGDEQEQTEGSADSDRDDATATRQNKGVGKRINELTREKHEERRAREAAEAKAAELERRLQALERGEPPQQQPAQQQPEGRPKLEDFDFDPEAHAEAVAKWTFERLEQEREARKQAEQRQATLAEKESAFIAENPDYREVAHAPNVPITQEMAEVILQADNPPAIAYYLGKNLSEAAEISRMSPLQQARAIGRIEMQLAAPKTPAAPTPPPTPVSKAPAPVATLKPSASVSKPLE